MFDIIDKIFFLEDFKKEVYENHPFVCLAFDNKERILEVNKRFCDATGWAKEEVIGKHYSEFVHPDDIEKDKEYVKNFHEGKGFIKGAGHYDNRYLTKKGNYITLRWYEDNLYNQQYKEWYYAFARIIDNA